MTHPVRDQTWPDYPGLIEPGRAGRVTYKLRLVDGQLETLIWLPEGHLTQLLDRSADRWRET